MSPVRDGEVGRDEVCGGGKHTLDAAAPVLTGRGLPGCWGVGGEVEGAAKEGNETRSRGRAMREAGGEASEHRSGFCERA